MKLRQLLLQVCQTLLAQGVVFFFQRSLLNFHLHDLTAQLVQLRRHGVHLGLDQCARFIHQVDRFIRQKPVRNITVGQNGGTYQCIIQNLYAVIHLITIL